MRFPKLKNTPARAESEAAHQVRVGCGPAIHLHDYRLTIDQVDSEPRLGMVPERRATIVCDVEVEGSISIDFYQRQGGAAAALVQCGLVCETSAAVVEEKVPTAVQLLKK